jgi:hypothetical protein
VCGEARGQRREGSEGTQINDLDDCRPPDHLLLLLSSAAARGASVSSAAHPIYSVTPVGGRRREGKGRQRERRGRASWQARSLRRRVGNRGVPACGRGKKLTQQADGGRGASTIIHPKIRGSSRALLELHFFLLVHPYLAMEAQAEALIELLLAS